MDFASLGRCHVLLPTGFGSSPVYLECLGLGDFLAMLGGMPIVTMKGFPTKRLAGTFPSLMDFDHTLGFPGEGPCVMPGNLSWICGACGCVGSSSHCLLVGLALTSTRVVFLAGLVCAAWLFFGFTWTCTLGVARTKPPLLIWILLGFLGVSQEVGAVSHAWKPLPSQLCGQSEQFGKRRWHPGFWKTSPWYYQSESRKAAFNFC